MSTDESIFDIFVSNITAIKSKDPKVNNRIATMNALETFINKQVIEAKQDEKFGLINLLKIPKSCEYHDGRTFVSFVRFEKTRSHGEAANFLNNLVLEGRPLSAKMNNIRSEDGQWYRTNNTHKLFDNQRLYYHDEKMAYIRRANDLMMGREQATILELRQQLLEKDKKIQELNGRVRSLEENLRREILPKTQKPKN
jgi:hypothetical protein